MKYRVEKRHATWWEHIGTYRNLLSAEQACEAEGRESHTIIKDEAGHVVRDYPRWDDQHV